MTPAQQRGRAIQVTQQKVQEAQARIEQTVKISRELIQRMGISPEAYSRVALNALIASPALAACEPRSLERAILKSCELGLLPDGMHAAIVPFKGVATLIPMIEGRLDMARAATPGIAIKVRAVFADDQFTYEEGIKPVLKHIPKPDGARGFDALVAVYALAKIPGSSEHEFEVFFRGDVDRYRSYSLSNAGPWSTHPIEMAKKAVLGQLLKRLPKKPGTPSVPADLLAIETNGLDGLATSPWDEGTIVDGGRGGAQPTLAAGSGSDAQSGKGEGKSQPGGTQAATGAGNGKSNGRKRQQGARARPKQPQARQEAPAEEPPEAVQRDDGWRGEDPEVAEPPF